MEKLKQLSNYHLGIGIITILLQIIFPISMWLFSIGLATIILSKYEKWIAGKMKNQVGQNEINRIFQNFKIVNIVGFVILGIVILTMISDFFGNENIVELIKSDPLVFINMIIIASSISIFFMNREIDKMRLSIE